MLLRCDGPACRLRASDCGLGARDGEATACLRRCDAPVAAVDAGRALTIVARGRIEPWVPPPLPPQPGAPVLLRDAGFRDQPTLEAARRRGVYAALAKLDAARAAELTAQVATSPDGGGEGGGGDGGDGDFAARVLCERDPHLALEGLAMVARGRGAGLRVPAALAEAAAAAREHLGAFEVGDGADVVQAARVARAAGLGTAHETILCALSGDVLRPGLYELLAGATVGAAIAAAGGVVAGVRVAEAAASLDPAAPAPRVLVVRHAGRAV